MRRLMNILLVVGILFAVSCGSREKQLPAAETFAWGDQLIAFQPPPSAWRREKHQEAGLCGVRFTLTGSVGERMYIAEYYQVGDCSRREAHRVVYNLGDVVEKVRFQPERFTEADIILVRKLPGHLVAGEPAQCIDFTMYHRARQYEGREFYFLKNNHLFVAAYLGLERNLHRFERIVTPIPGTA